MPDHGRLSEDRVAHTAPVLSPLYPPPPWKLPGARMLRVLFETDKEPLLTWLPPKLTRSTPPYAIISIESYPESPVGPFSLATQYIGCRAGFFIRAFALQAVVDSVPALAALREAWGVPCKLGRIELSSKKGRVKGTVIRRDKLARVRLEDPEPIEPDLVRVDPVLCLRLAPSLQEQVRHDLIQLVQLDPEYEIKWSSRGRASVTYPTSGEDDAWDVLPCRNVISAVHCELDTELPLARFVMPY
ncbi:MAG TPA: acetoacetate decarboxylase family protein [Dehalococcoidia bacterium]|jgi:acetoacetate decarboxylase|nr:acetoacetate decarboxylase family protein [Dehalococcoidia bacterium]